jgi:TPR repeat protein
MVEALWSGASLRVGRGALRAACVCMLCWMAAFAIAAERDSPQRLEERAHALMSSDPPQWKAAREAFEQAADVGSTRAMSYVGWMYEHGHGVAVDKAMAARWYERAALGGAHDYAIKLGWMHLAGDGMQADREQAEAWFSHAIEADHDPARIALASVLIADATGGRATDRVSEARGLLETAYAGGERLAAFFLARIHVEGVGGHPVDMARGARYVRIAAEDGHAQMQGWLALMHAKGDGVEADRMESAFWAALAASGGDVVGQRLHAAYASEMSADERRLIMERSLRWSAESEERQ